MRAIRSGRGLLRPGQMFPVSWNLAGVPCGSISVRTESDAVVLIFRSQHPGDTEWKSTEQRVPILWTAAILAAVAPGFAVRTIQRDNTAAGASPSFTPRAICSPADTVTD